MSRKSPKFYEIRWKLHKIWLARWFFIKFLRPIVTILSQRGTAGLNLLVKQRRPPFERCDNEKRKHSVVDRVVIKWVIFPFPGLNKIIIFLLVIYFIGDSYFFIFTKIYLEIGFVEGVVFIRDEFPFPSSKKVCFGLN